MSKSLQGNKEIHPSDILFVIKMGNNISNIRKWDKRDRFIQYNLCGLFDL